ncbi:MAG: hypothetical protein RL670_154 [Actinomycetota bacterium]|jgi:6-phosphogluconolactonase
MAEIRKYADLPATAEAIAEALLTRLAELLGQQREVHLAVTGGTLGIALLAATAKNAKLKTVDWSRVNVWWGDERFVAADSADRNDGQAIRALFHLLPQAKLHQMPADDGLPLEFATVEFLNYAAEFAVDGAIPFDITLLGMGPDGHVASLFPDRPIPPAEMPVVPVHDSPKPPPQRISFNYGALNASDEIWFVVAGADKAEAVAVAHSAEKAKLPAGRVLGKSKTIWFLDEAAASLLG